MKLTDPMGTLREAVEQLEIAEVAIDQAHAMLKDLKLHDYIQSGMKRTIKTVSLDVSGLLEDLKNVRCPDCNEPMADNLACLEDRCPTLAESMEALAEMEAAQ